MGYTAKGGSIDSSTRIMTIPMSSNDHVLISRYPLAEYSITMEQPFIIFWRFLKIDEIAHVLPSSSNAPSHEHLKSAYW